MSPVAQESVDQVRKAVQDVLAGKTSKGFMDRIEGVLNDWKAGTLTAAQACDKIKKSVALFVGQDLAQEIGNRCAPIVMRESTMKQ